MDLLKELKDRIMAMTWFYKMCHNKKIVVYLGKELWPEWKSESQAIFTKDAVSELKKNLDNDSCKVLDNYIQKIAIDLALRKYDFSINFSEYTEDTYPDYQEYQKNVKPEFIKKGLFDPLEETSLYYHHGMRFLPESVKNYVKDKIFIDGGAWIGDSSLVFLNYFPKRVLAFDISEKNAKIFRRIMKKNNITENQIMLIQKGLGDKNEYKNIQDGEGSITTFHDKGNSNVEIVPLDSCKEIDSSVGWIKIDLEGYGLPAVKGMVETIKRDRPVLTLAVYHCADELFGIKALIESLDLNYKMMFRSCRFDGYHELTLIAYPAELDI